MEKRRDTVEGAHRRAKDLENQINEKMDRYQGQLQEAKLKGSQEKAVLRRDAAAQEARILSAAREQAGDHVQTIKNKVAAEAAEASRYLKGEAGMLASQLASRVLGRGL
jgi:F-type H+-transporting ATPase subunit b